MFCAVVVEVVKRLIICICISEILHIEIANIHRDDVVQKRRHPRARKILITTEEVLEPGERTVSKFLSPLRQPTRHLSLIVSPKTAIWGEKLRNLPLIYDS